MDLKPSTSKAIGHEEPLSLAAQSSSKQLPSLAAGHTSAKGVIKKMVCVELKRCTSLDAAKTLISLPANQLAMCVSAVATA